MTKDELAAALKMKLPKKPSHDELVFHARNQERLIAYLFSTIAIQGSSIIALRKENVEIKGDLLAAGIVTAKGESELVGFDEPSIIMPGKAN